LRRDRNRHRWRAANIKETALLANILLKKLAADAGAFETHHAGKRELTEGSSTTVHVLKDGVIHTRRTATTYSREPRADV